MAIRWLLTLTLLPSLFLPVTAAKAQTLDQYGGYTSLPVPGGGTGYFRVAKLGNRWVFATPAGNAFWMRGVFNATYDDRFVNIATKYGSSGTWGKQVVRRMKSWGFNTHAEYANANVLPGQPGIEQLPFVMMVKPSAYGVTNYGGLAPGPFKDLVECLDLNVYTGWSGGATSDVFDPNFDAFVNAWTKFALDDPYWSGLSRSAWAIGITMDDNDYLLGFGPGPDIATGHEHPHLGWFAIAVAPTKASSARYKQTYADTKVYTKYALRDFLIAQYGTIASLNAAWGSNYTTFESAGGWGAGTGLLDENGRHTAWLGSRDGNLAGAAPGVIKDLDAFLYQFATRYFSVVTRWARVYAPNQLVFSPASFNGFGGVTRKQILQAAGESVDVLNAGIGSQLALDKTAQYAGDKPITTWEGYVANPDSALYASPNPPPGDSKALALSFHAQQARGQNYTTRMAFMLKATTAAGNLPIVGFKFWSWADLYGEKLNWGLTSLKDNAYDGKEAVMASGTDPWGFRTGGEDRNYGNFLSYVTTANATVAAALGAGSGGGSTGGGKVYDANGNVGSSAIVKVTAK
jgi:hypothetical protein